MYTKEINNIPIYTKNGSIIANGYNYKIYIDGIEYLAIRAIEVNENLFKFSNRSGAVIDDMYSTKLYSLDNSGTIASMCLRSNKNSKKRVGYVYINMKYIYNEDKTKLV